MTFFRDRWEGVGAIAAETAPSRGTPAPTVSRKSAAGYLVSQTVPVRRSRVPMVAPISEVETRMPPLVRVPAPGYTMATSQLGVTVPVQVGSGIGTPAPPRRSRPASPRGGVKVGPMSYTRQPTTLIAREGYSDYVAVGDTTPTCTPGSVWNASLQACELPTSTSTPTDTSHWYDPLVSVFGAGATAYTAQQQAAAAQAKAAAAQASATPPWLLPVALGGIGLILVMSLVSRPRPVYAAPASNPARRRRRRARRARRNPATFTAKGERMYRHIRDRYAREGEPRAKEIAARTVYARARRERGLVRKH